MSNVRSEGTKPERAVRSLLHRMGYRFRLNRKDLPGKPDIVLPSRKIAIFVHGCFWHEHTCKKGKTKPSSNRKFWFDKIKKNKLRDRSNVRKLRALGWKVLMIWECQTVSDEKLSKILERGLSEK